MNRAKCCLNTITKYSANEPKCLAYTLRLPNKKSLIGRNRKVRFRDISFFLKQVNNKNLF